MQAYLIMMAIRLIEMRRILQPTGSIYLHCDPTASHYLKALMDCVFGRTNFRNEIVWHYYNKDSPGRKAFGRDFDQILFYAPDKAGFTPQREQRDKPVRQLLRENVNGVLRNKRGPDGKLMYRTVTDKKVSATWRIPCVQPASKQYTGCPTQMRSGTGGTVQVLDEPEDLIPIHAPSSARMCLRQPVPATDPPLP